MILKTKNIESHNCFSNYKELVSCSESCKASPVYYYTKVLYIRSKSCEEKLGVEV